MAAASTKSAVTCSTLLLLLLLSPSSVMVSTTTTEPAEDVLLVFCQCPFGYYESSRFPVLFQFPPPCGDSEVVRTPPSCGRWRTYGLRCSRCHSNCLGCHGPDDAHCDTCREGFFNVSFVQSESSKLSSSGTTTTSGDRRTSTQQTFRRRRQVTATDVQDVMVDNLIVTDQLLPMSSGISETTKSELFLLQASPLHGDDTADSGSGSVHDDDDDDQQKATTTTTTTRKPPTNPLVWRPFTPSPDFPVELLAPPVKRNFRMTTATTRGLSPTRTEARFLAPTSEYPNWPTATATATTTHRPQLAPTIRYSRYTSRRPEESTASSAKGSGRTTGVTDRRNNVTASTLTDVERNRTTKARSERRTTTTTTRMPSTATTNGKGGKLESQITTTTREERPDTSPFVKVSTTETWATAASSSLLTQYYRCVAGCPDGTYPDREGASVCRVCDSKCKTCVGPSFLNCTSCSASAVKVVGMYTATSSSSSSSVFTCLSGCPGNHFNNNGTCTECHPNCDGCIAFGTTHCLRCKHSPDTDNVWGNQVTTSCDGQPEGEPSSLELILPLAFLAFLVLLTVGVCLRWNYKAKDLLCRLPQLTKVCCSKNGRKELEEVRANGNLPSALPKSGGRKAKKSRNEYTSSPSTCSNCQAITDDGYELPLQPSAGPSGVVTIKNNDKGSSSAAIPPPYSTPSSANPTLAKSRRNDDPLPPTPVELDALMKAKCRAPSSTSSTSKHDYKNIPANSKAAQASTSKCSDDAPIPVNGVVLVASNYANSESLYANC